MTVYGIHINGISLAFACVGAVAIALGVRRFVYLRRQKLVNTGSKRERRYGDPKHKRKSNQALTLRDPRLG